MKFGLDRWSFGREMSSLQREMDRFFDQFASQLPQPLASKQVDFVPACDVDETDGQYHLKVDVPGFKKENLKVELAEHVLTISGEHKEEKTEGKKSRHVTERRRGYFERSFYLPESVDAGKVEAHFAEGVLQVNVPKTTAAKTKQIPIAESKPAIKAGAPKEKELSAPPSKVAVA